MVLTWLRRRDRGLIALRRAGRTAIVMPAMFAVGDLVIGNTTTAAFAAFDSFASLLLFDPPGTMRARLRAQLALAVAGAILVCLGTVAEQSAPTAAVATAIVTFGSSSPASSSSRWPAPRRRCCWPSSSGSRCRGRFLDPRPARRLGPRVGRCAARRRAAVAGTGARSRPLRGDRRVPRAGARLGTEVAHRLGETDRPSDADYAAAVAEANARVAALHDVFFATPYRPTGLSTAAARLSGWSTSCSGSTGMLVHAASPVAARRPVGLRRQARRRGDARARGGD